MIIRNEVIRLLTAQFQYLIGAGSNAAFFEEQETLAILTEIIICQMKHIGREYCDDYIDRTLKDIESTEFADKMISENYVRRRGVYRDWLLSLRSQ